MGTAVVSGYTETGFEAVRRAFADNFEHRHELGAACCVYHRGEKVVDLWGGVRDRETGEPWQEDTMVLVFSLTKGMAGLAMALAHSRRHLEYDERVCAYWPEFAQQGKAGITVRQLLSHQAGLFVLDEPLDEALVRDLDRLADVPARQKPAWEPGTRQGYHGITLGFYEGELLRRVDPLHRSLGQFFQEEIASPLGIDFFICLPEEIPDSRLAPLQRPGPARMVLSVFTLPPALALTGIRPGSNLRRALLGSELPEQAAEGRIFSRGLEIPAGGGVGTARAIARAYSEFVTGGASLGLRDETLRQIMASPEPPVRGFRDECLTLEVAFSLGFMKPGGLNTFAHPSAFGAPGFGGSFGFGDPDSGLGWAYVTNRIDRMINDPRELVVRKAVYASIGADGES